MNGGNVGYNISKIDELLTEIANGYTKIGDAMCENWGACDNVIRTNWIGPDEVTNENELVASIHYLYGKCKEGVQNVIEQVTNIGRYWIEFQKKNVMIGAGTGTVSEITQPTLKDAPVESTVAKVEPNWNESTNLGLQSRDAAKNIDSAIDAYVDGVYNATKNLYNSLDSSQAFLGQQSSAIDTYLKELGEGMAKLTTCHNTIKNNLHKLAEAYIEADTDVNSSMNTKSQSAQSSFDYKSENII